MVGAMFAGVAFVMGGLDEGFNWHPLKTKHAETAEYPINARHNLNKLPILDLVIAPIDR